VRRTRDANGGDKQCIQKFSRKTQTGSHQMGGLDVAN
jgi:hypothetical protein